MHGHGGYIVLPGQALSCKIGELKIKELRARATTALGSAFDVREFPALLLADGALPLDVLDAKVERWILRLTAARGVADREHLLPFRTSPRC